MEEGYHNLFLVRHGESTENIQAMNYGDPSWVSDLTSLGIEQAQEAAALIMDAAPGVMHLCNISVSPYVRAVKTCNLIAYEISKKCENWSPNILVTEHPFLAEIHHGDFEGIPRNVRKNEHYDRKIEYAKISKNHYWIRYPNGESPADMAVRLSLYLNNVNLNNNHIIVAHALTIRVLMMLLMRESVDYYNNFPHINNASVRHLTHTGDRVFKDRGFLKKSQEEK